VWCPASQRRVQEARFHCQSGKYVDDLSSSATLGGHQATKFKSEQPRLKALTVIQQKVTRKWSEEHLLDI